jgi:hypothetical protein
MRIALISFWAEHARDSTCRRAERARQSCSHLSTAMERCARPGASGHPAQSPDWRSLAGPVALGPDPILVQGPWGRPQADQCQVRDRAGPADLPRGLPQAALHRAGGHVRPTKILDRLSRRDLEHRPDHQTRCRNRLHRRNSRIQPGAPMCSTRVETNHATSAAGTAAAATATILINVGS